MFFQGPMLPASDPYRSEYHPNYYDPYSPYPLVAARSATVQANQPAQAHSQLDPAIANLVDAGLSLAVPQYPLIKAGAEVLNSPTVPWWAKAAAVGLGVYFLSPGIKKEVDKTWKNLFG